MAEPVSVRIAVFGSSHCQTQAFARALVTGAAKKGGLLREVRPLQPMVLRSKSGALGTGVYCEAFRATVDRGDQPPVRVHCEVFGCVLSLTQDNALMKEQYTSADAAVFLYRLSEPLSWRYLRELVSHAFTGALQPRMRAFVCVAQNADEKEAVSSSEVKQFATRERADTAQVLLENDINTSSLLLHILDTVVAKTLGPPPA